MEQRGKVISKDGNIATVELVRESACSSCHHRDSCGAGIIAGCSKSESVTVRANNLCGADVGDSVVLNSASSKILGIAFCVFVLPLILTFLTYLVCDAFGMRTFITAIVSACVFVISFFTLFFGMNKSLEGKVTVNITGIIDEKYNEVVTE